MSRLLRRYPVEVAYPFAGVRYLLRWYEYNVGHNLIMTRSESDMIKRFMWRYDRERGVKPEEYLKVTLVTPPEKYERYYAKRCHLNDFECFRWDMHWRAAQIKELLGQAPFPFVACEKYEPKYPEETAPDPDHSYCKNCQNGVKVEENKHWLWIYYNRNGSRYTRSRKVRLSRAQQPSPNKPIYCATEQGGVALGPLVSESGRFTVWPSNNILFFYQVDEVLELPKPIIERIELDKLAKEIKELTRKEEEKKFDFRYLEKILLEYRDLIK